MGRSRVILQPPAGDFLSADEFIGALEALSPDERLKLADIEALRRGGTGFTPGELVQDAIFRTLAGERNCPRDVPFMAFMAQTMRSIASHDRRQRGRERSLEEMQAAGSAAADGGTVDPPALGPSPEDQVMQNQDAAAVQTIHGRFEDDEEAQLVLLGWQDDLRGAALREATGLDQGQLDYAIRRIRTRMRKTYPQGWMT
jgi:DNA-directed RNA polymerase specialized sigma24 family protein